jgi:toxin ParE1/3/4
VGLQAQTLAASMQVVWTEPALEDLVHIHDYIAVDSLSAAARVAGAIRHAVGQLSQHPHMGRVGREPGTRELVIAGTRYFVSYAVRRNRVEIYAVLHGAQEKRPPYAE